MNVAIDDGDYFVQYGSEYMVQEYKKKWTNNTDTPSFTWIGRTTYDTRISPLLIQIYNVNTGTTTATDSYSQTNQDSTQFLYKGVGFQGLSQSFTAGSDCYVPKVAFYIRRTGSPPGTVTANIYSHSGTYGTSSIPGSLMATSIPIDTTTLTSSLTLVDFTFNTPVKLTNGTKYVVSIEYNGGNASNSLEVGVDASSPSHGGNEGRLFTNAWSALSSEDVCFFVYITPWETLATINTVPADTDFAKTVTQSTNVSNYYDSKNIVTFRVYQQVF
jgi:hypothetical protein